ncbi:MAG: SDR family oxidoreductase [Acidimicrobiales bacterium]|nr:SDR family oxidoreductase [Acidimicrobiales bacterium]
MTGAARGIGAAIARLAAGRGYRVGILDVDADGARSLAAELPGAEALVTATDDEPGVLAALDAFATATGRAAPDLVVCNAGIVRFGPLADLALDDWRRVVDVNLTGTFVVARAAATRMAAAGRGGSIEALPAIHGVAPGPNAGAYGATKSAVALLMAQLAIEFGPAGVRANAVAPGLIDGGMSGPIYADEAVRSARSRRVPLGRLGTEDDVARVVLFLGSEEAAYVSGQELVVDGGVVNSIIATLPRPQAVDGVGPDAR